MWFMQRRRDGKNGRRPRRPAASVEFRPNLEILESRSLPSVTGSVIAGNLILTGDGSNDELVIDQFGVTDGQFRVRGENGTTINGQPSQVFSGVTRDIRARLQGGSDQLRL